MWGLASHKTPICDNEVQHVINVFAQQRPVVLFLTDPKCNAGMPEELGKKMMNPMNVICVTVMAELPTPMSCPWSQS